ncbi:hypothetical protein BDZ94DRAFT_1309776 [Collybia nuda]|uniref:Uncharacterized protein n=1 Tax=Collybia nuda TaxID=64659 RepID=A0A9P6CDZ8_9AGAR|nr:hypothetical protein BDZ94DRAFT_1309776 [Collybia nuda]
MPAVVIYINRHPIPATFDSHSSSSSLPSTVFFSLAPLGFPLLTTVATSAAPFSTLVPFSASLQDGAVLGLDWFSSFREFYIAQGSDPPFVEEFSLAIPVSVPLQLPLTSYIKPLPAPPVEFINGATSSTYALPAVDIALETLCNPYSSLYALGPVSPVLIVSALHAHGLLFPGLSPAHQQEVLIHHIMNGLCSHSPHADCHAIAHDSDPKHLAYEISCHVQKAASAGCIPIQALHVIAQGLGYAVDAASDEYLCLSNILNACLPTILNPPCVSLSSMFSSFDEYVKASYLSFAAHHGISCGGMRENILATFVECFWVGNCITNLSPHVAC